MPCVPSSWSVPTSIDEPTNPAQLFLRRARSLLELNFLELMKELAPNALDEVARVVGVDPNSVGSPEP